MTKDKDEKAVIRARMAKTGESYATAKAQLSKEQRTDRSPATPGQLILTEPARRAVSASASPGSTAWHLVLALRASQGTAARVLERLGMPMSRFTEVAAREQLGADQAAPSTTWANALVAANRMGKDLAVSSGQLLQAAVAALGPGDVPESRLTDAKRLRDADLAALCAADVEKHGPEVIVDTGAKPTLFERFTDRSRVAIVAAQEEARALGHNYIGTEHLLLGLVKEGNGVAARVITDRGVSLESLRDEVERIIARGTDAPESHIPFTPRSKSVLELSLREAEAMESEHIGTEHLLLALLSEGDGVAAQVLRHHGLTAEGCRSDVVDLLARLKREG